MRNLVIALAVLAAAPASATAAEEALGAQVGAVAPDVLALTVEAGRVEYGRQEPYEKLQGDQRDEWQGKVQPWVRRNGKPVGGLVGEGGKLIKFFDRIVGPPLDTAWADQPASYTLVSSDDPDYRTPQKPAAVYRKTKPSDLAQTGGWQFDAPLRHVLYLKLPRPMKPGKRYTVAFDGAKMPEQAFVFDPAQLVSEAIHVTHLGFRPDDPSKVAFLSCWMGTGGGLAQQPGRPFQVVDAKTGRPVFQGKTTLRKAADDVTEDAYKKNYHLADIGAMDFSALETPGTYRLVVEGVGCSPPFEIGADAWRKAFVVSAKGFYHQRSGIALGPPYTTFKRPRCFHPDDGVKVYHSTCPLMDSGNGLNALGTDTNNFGNLVKGRTDRLVSDAWGGYFDAGDWDRRIQHLEATRLLLELALGFPEFVASVRLNIPESGNDLPDLVDEALWNLDCYRRMQTPEGGIRGGIESAEHPQFGEASWQESLPIMAYAPGLWSSYVYAGDAARAALVLEGLGQGDLANVYRASALGAMRWAEKRFADHGYQKLPHPVVDARNLAAAELWRLTGEAGWHEVFLATTVFKDAAKDVFVWQSHDQADAAFVYALTERDGADAAVRRSARSALLRAADVCAELAGRSAFGYVRRTPWNPFLGLMGAPRGTEVIRAHWLTGDAKYLAAAVLACQCGAGANPDNLCYTTGLGHKSPRHPLVVDQRVTGQTPPPGITVYGPIDVSRNADHWALKLLRPFCVPAPQAWPTTEAYFDMYLFPEVCEFTVMQSLGPNAYAWGYLAARK